MTDMFSRFFIFFCLGACLWAPSSFASEYLGKLTDLNQQLQEIEWHQLYKSREWILLGHYQKRWSGYESEVDGPHFFLSPLGKISPLEELKATLKAFYEPLDSVPEEKNHPQCRFLARRQWLIEKLSLAHSSLQLLPCEFHKNWKKQLNAERISMIFASAYMNNPSSMFGHTFLKFHSPENSGDQDLLNYGVNFAATTGSDGGMAFMIKGLFGGYPGEFSLTPYYMKLLTYSNIEGRDIWEYELNFSKEEVDRMLNHLFELEQTYFDYYFFSENCSYHLLSLLEWARPSLHFQNRFFYHVIPMDTLRLIAAEPGLVVSRHFRPALDKNLEGYLDLLNASELSLVRDFFSMPEVQNFLGKIQSLEKSRQALVLDTLLAYGAIKEFRAQEQWKEPLFQLKTARAKLLLPSERLKIPSRQGPPENAHPPARLGMGAGYQKTDFGFLDLSFRFAFHELTDSEVGILRGAQIKSFSAQARYFEESEKIQFTQFRLFDLISLSPWGSYKKPISWKAALGYDNFFGEDLGILSGGIGSTWNLNQEGNWIFALFLDGEIDYNKELEASHLFGAGPSMITKWAISDHLRALLKSQSLWETRKGEWRFRTQADISYNWNRFQQIRLNYTSQQGVLEKSDEVSLLWEVFFLL